jgi:hypothetical protein
VPDRGQVGILTQGDGFIHFDVDLFFVHRTSSGPGRVPFFL